MAEPDRLHLLYEISRRLTTFTDLDELVRYATRRTREVFAAEGCSLLLLDAEQQEFHFPVASQSESRAASQAQLAEIRFPADRGIAGSVLRDGEPALVADASSDPRFYSGVDQQTGLATRAVLCAPLRTRAGNIGVIEVINPAVAPLTEADLEFLEALGSDIALAYEKTTLYEQLRNEALSLRQVLAFAGGALVAVGLVFGLGAALGHLAVALPLTELVTRPRIWGSALAVLAGVLLVAVARGWLVIRRVT